MPPTSEAISDCAPMPRAMPEMPVTASSGPMSTPSCRRAAATPTPSSSVVPAWFSGRTIFCANRGRRSSRATSVSNVMSTNLFFHAMVSHRQVTSASSLRQVSKKRSLWRRQLSAVTTEWPNHRQSRVDLACMASSSRSATCRALKRYAATVKMRGDISRNATSSAVRPATIMSALFPIRCCPRQCSSYSSSCERGYDRGTRVCQP
mmetsp:Transcript_14593/g.37433  ORF Transcript_14593/g.37433 Transcript_14593/m.37433 type:complete len:206 (+) Transcript_14593:881-1498(+)